MYEKEMKEIKIAIVDTLSLHSNGKIFGHFEKVAIQYYDILNSKFDVTIMGGSAYSVDNRKFTQLPCDICKIDFDSASKVRKIINKLKAVINIIAALLSDNEALIFQDCNQSVLYMLLRFYRGKKKIFLIKYNIETRNKTDKLLYNLKNHVAGVITNLESVAKHYRFENYVIVPDYFPMNPIDAKEKKIYDFVCLGTVIDSKDYEDVTTAISKSKRYTLKIAGYFKDKKRHSKLLKYENERISIEDKYLSDEEYDYLIKSSKYVVLPYKAKGYNNRSSGVVLDSVYKGTPVICSNLEAFRFVKEYTLGIVYKDGFHNALQDVKTVDYSKLCNNILEWVDLKNKDKERLLNFVYAATLNGEVHA